MFLFCYEASTGNDEDKGLVGLLDESKGNNCFPHQLIVTGALCCKFYIFCFLGPYSALTLYVFAADQAVSESIPLSPQWLYAKPNEPKMVNVLPYLIPFHLIFDVNTMMN